MSKQKKFLNRLDDLFSDLGDQVTQVPSPSMDEPLETSPLPGWTWECDARGVFNRCSPEIERVLGLESQQVIGQSLYTYRLSDESITALQSVFNQGGFPAEITLHYQAQDRRMVPVRAHIFPVESIGDTPRGWRGFNHVITVDQPIRLSPAPRHSPEDFTPQQSFRVFGRETMGAAIEADQVMPISGPISPVGKTSLQQRSPIVVHASQDHPAELAIPVTFPNQSIGILEILDPTPNRQWSSDEQRLVEQVADQLAQALENARLFQETQVSLSRTEALYNVGQAAIGFENLEELLQAVTHTIAEVLPADRAQVFVLEASGQKVAHSYQSHNQETRRNEEPHQDVLSGVTGWCIQEKKPALLTKAHIDPRETHQAYQMRQRSGSGTVMIVPLVYQGEVFGALSAINGFNQPDFNEGDLDLLLAMSNQVANAVANARLFQEEQNRRRIADTLSQTARVVGATLEIQDVAKRLLFQLSEAVTFNHAALYVLDGNRFDLIGQLSQAENEAMAPVEQTRTNPPDEPLFQLVVNSGVPLIITDTHQDDRWITTKPVLKIRSWIGAPLLSGDQAIGVLQLDHPEPGIYDQENADLITAIAAQVAVAIRNAALYQQVQRRSIQLQTAAEVSRAASSILEPNPLIQQAVNLIRDRFNLYYVGLFLVDEAGDGSREPGQWAILRAGTGEPGRIQVERGHRLAINSESMIGECIRTSKSQTPKTIYEAAPRYINPLLPETRTEIALPLISRGTVIGAMSIQSTVENAFTTEDVAILQTMADQVANALQNANLFDQTQARADELDILNEMSRTLSRDLEIGNILRSIYLYTSRLIDTSTFFIALYDSDTNMLAFPFATEDNKEIQIQTRPLGTGLTEYVIQTRETVLIQENVESWLKQHNIELRLTGTMPQSWLGAPLAIGEQSLGIICVQNQVRYHFNEHHRDLLNAIANQSAIVLQNAQLFRQTQAALSNTEALLTITSMASSSLDLRETLSNVLDHILKTIDSDAGLISIANPFTNQLDLLAHQLPKAMLRGLEIKGLEGSLCDWVYQQGTPLVLDDLSVNAPVDASGAIAMGFSSYQGVPLGAKGRVLGTLCTFSKRRLTPRENDISLLNAVGQQIGVAIENASLFEQTQSQAAELAILNEMSRVLSTIFNIEEIIHTIHEYSSRLMDTTYFFVALYNEKDDEVSFPFVTEKGVVSSIPSMKKRRGLTQHVIDTKEPLLISHDVKQRISELGLEEITVGEPAESWLGVPLIIGNSVLGVIATQNADTPRVFNERHKDLMISIARQSAIAIQTARLFQTTQQRVRDLTTLSNASQTLASAPLDIREVAAIVAEQVGEIVSKNTTPSIALRDPLHPDLMRMIITASIQDGAIAWEPAPEKFDYKLSEYPATQMVVERVEPKLIHRSDRDADPVELRDMAQYGIGTLLMLPLTVKGQVIGVMELETWGVETLYSPDERTLLSTLANQAAISLENARLYQEQLETAEQLRELDKLKTQFLANMSHELRTPLNSIIGFSRVIMKGIDGPVTDLQQQDLSAIYNAGQHLLKMINDILDISKVDAGKMELAFEDVNIFDIINSVMSTARGLVKDKPIQLLTAIEDNLPMVYADPTRIRQVLLNLISNAAKFTDQGSITVTARRQTNPQGKPELYLSVSDTGIGIAPEDQVKLFEPFVQVDGSPTRATGGTGLGLSITRMLVELHHGEIHIDSALGEGSTFYLSLPLEEPPGDDSIQPTNMSILSIDDDPQIVQLYERYLGETNFQVIPLNNPASAMAYAREIQPFLITLDVQLVEADGWQILEALKNDPDTSQIPIVICSLQDEIEKGIALGADDYLVKPILADDFKQAINRIWDRVQQSE